MSDSDGSGGSCPVCDRHTLQENLEAQGLILTGMAALFNSDDVTIEMVNEQLGGYEAHVAISLAAAFMHDLAVVSGVSLDAILVQYRSNLNAAQAEETP